MFIFNKKTYKIKDAVYRKCIDGQNTTAYRTGIFNNNKKFELARR